MPRFLIILALPLLAAGQDAKKPEPKYEMTTYVMGLLRRGPNAGGDAAEAARIQEGHMANIRKMAETGKLIVAGPFGDDTDLRGVFIFKVNSVEEARALAAPDPAIQSGRLVLELHPWYAAAGLKVDPPK
jgi:uncharacterized protein YciI